MQDYFKVKTWVITILMFVVAFGLSLAIVYYELGFRQNIKTSSASVINNITGWGWNPNIGWISFNCTNDSPACASSSYGVSVNLSAGSFSGYAWNSTAGWIDFGPLADLVSYPGCGYPEAACNSAKYIPSTGAVTGWAKILSMGNDGWIKLSGSWTNGVAIDSSSGVFTGWAWNANDDSSGIGWISFNCSNDDPACGSSNYKVVGSINSSPQVLNLTAPNWSYAQAGANSLRANLKFNFVDSDSGSYGSAYQIVVKKADDTTVLDTGVCTGYLTPSASCKIDNTVCMKNNPTGCVNLGNCVCQYTLDDALLSYNQGYKWSVTAWDNTAASATASYNTNPDTDNDNGVVSTFTTYKHKFPKVSATYFPASPNRNEKVKFTDTSKTYLTALPTTEVDCDSSKCSWLWTVSADATIDDTATSTPTITFYNSGSNSVTLKVTDKIDGYYSQIVIPVDVNVKLPSWKEVKP